MGPIAAAFVQYLTGAQATPSFRQRGMLLVKEPWPAVAAPTLDPQPQPAPQDPTGAEPAPSET